MLEGRFSTAAELEALANLPENVDSKFELHGGFIYKLPVKTPRHAWMISHLTCLLGNSVAEYDLGFVFSDSIQYQLPNGDVFIPDVSFVSKQRQPSLPARFLIAPDLAIEVFSPGNRERQMNEKVESYLRSGTQRVWVIYPEAKVVEVYQLSPDGGLLFHTFGLDASLDGETILPGLTIPVRDLFPQ
jgi:Uma2 family endonuclease